MSMIKKSITVTNQQDAWIKTQIESGQYGNDSELVRDLIRREQARQSQLEALRDALEEGELSGVSDRSIMDIVEDVKRKYKKRS